MGKKKVLRFATEFDTITDDEQFFNNKSCVSELQKLIEGTNYEIGFCEDNTLVCNGVIFGNTNKECDAEHTIFKARLKEILEKYYGKLKPVDVAKIYSTRIF